MPQDRETPPQRETHGKLNWRWTYARAAETRLQNEVGQDCIAVEHAADGFVFAVCDGVSQSFFGDLAATALAEGLVRWLGTLSVSTPEAEIERELGVLLERLQPEVTDEVDNFPLPKGLPPMLGQVLDQKRSLGSESMFVCGRLWLPSAQSEARLVLGWLGDMRLRLWQGAQEQPIAGAFRTEDRWSSRRGLVAGRAQWCFPPVVPGATRVLAYSDGLANLDTLAEPPSDAALQAAIDAAQRSPTSDDISLVDFLVP